MYREIENKFFSVFIFYYINIVNLVYYYLLFSLGVLDLNWFTIIFYVIQPCNLIRDFRSWHNKADFYLFTSSFLARDNFA